ncbi:response regulator [Paenibacillus sacheonensis]|uniref:Response regulator n=1 Tax=Paenibacillus sacheonensis TaxID=742054 RepID=A0A7X5BZD9_9BACL|nr:response regulator [Paenibacillus sacheonensis]MBM7568885.1 two-component system response regulator YesN [Paenibacillus sacheonensis]NBC72588.1 response regulator [Paenibacillus sacheonensis]
MNVLLVDDDYFVVTALEKKIDWASLDIENVHTANNVAQAREILKHHDIQILVSDIEMPQGSGLELLAWIREEQYNVQAIFLTNYADFNYAQKAIELRSFEYFLKPIQFDKLMLIIRKAVERAKEQQQNDRAIQEGRYWQRNQAKILEHFWRKLISGSASSPIKPAEIAGAVDEQHLGYAMDDTVQPVLFSLFPHDGSMGRDEKNLFDFALLNVLYELFGDEAFTVETVLEYRTHQWIAVLRWNRTPDDGTLADLCASFIDEACRSLKSDACCIVALSGTLEDVSAILRQLLQLNEELVKRRGGVFFAGQYRRPAEGHYAPPDLARLEELLDQGRSAEFLEETTRYLDERSRRPEFTTSVLSLFRLDMMQLVYAFLKSKGIQAHQLYTGRANEQLLAHSLHSCEDMEAYLRSLVNTAMEYRRFAEQPKSVADEIKQYIHAHCGEDLTRNSLADVVYLHPDYLARLFKKETGVSLGTYIIQARIAAAKQQLRTTDLSVFSVAKKVGYANYSYFAKVFKQETGVTPNEFKQSK